MLEIEKNVFQFKMSAPMVGHLGKEGKTLGSKEVS